MISLPEKEKEGTREGKREKNRDFCLTYYKLKFKDLYNKNEFEKLNFRL